jgi:polysaccharide export outer membrane protein
MSEPAPRIAQRTSTDIGTDNKSTVSSRAPKGKPWQSWKVRLRLLTMISTALVSFQARAEYVLDQGDIIEVSVFGKNEQITRRTTVDVDGNVVIPFVGEVPAAGVSLSRLRATVTGMLTTSSSIRSTDIAVQLVEARPFYIQGDVMRAGAYPYRSGSTVRQAIAIAGGYSTLQAANITPLAVAELRGRYRALKGEVAKSQVRVAGLRAELQNKAEIDIDPRHQRSPSPAGTVDAPLEKALSEIAEIEIRRLKSRIEDKQKEKQHLSTSVKLADSQVAALEQGQKQDQEAVAQQVSELDRVADLARRGLAASGRVTDEQRAAVLIKSREMDTRARLAAAQISRQEAQRRLESDDPQTLKLPQDLQDAIAQLAQNQAQLDALGEQLVMAGESLEQLDGGERRRAIDVVIYRKQNGETVRVDADEDTEIAPSDVVEIRVRYMGARAASIN